MDLIESSKFTPKRTIKLLLVKSINVRGFNYFSKRSLFFFFLKNLESDINLLQETHKMSKFPECEGFSLNFGTHSSYGITILFNPSLSKTLDTKPDYDGLNLSLKLSFQNQIVNIVNIYAPNIPINFRKTFY